MARIIDKLLLACNSHSFNNITIPSFMIYRNEVRGIELNVDFGNKWEVIINHLFYPSNDIKLSDNFRSYIFLPQLQNLNKYDSLNISHFYREHKPNDGAVNVFFRKYNLSSIAEFEKLPLTQKIIVGILYGYAEKFNLITITLAGLDPNGIVQIFELISNLVEFNSFLIVSHSQNIFVSKFVKNWIRIE